MAATGVCLLLTGMPPAPAQLRSVEAPSTNPDLPQACGLNVLMILDESGSIGRNAGNVRTAFKAFTAAMKNTSSSMAVAEFSRVARLPAIGSFAPGAYITITDQTKSQLDNYVDNRYNPGGNTNWEDGLRMGRSGSAFAPRPSLAVPHLTVFITDGDPTQVIRGDRVRALEYLNKVPLESRETSRQNKDRAADAAVANANNLKAQNSHILVVAVGNGVSSSDSLDRIVKISGPDIYPDSGNDFNISTDDVYREQDFSKLQDALRKAAFQLCSPSVTIEKVVDLTPDPGSLDDAVPGSGWQISGSVSAPGSGEFAWVLPSAEDPGVNPKFAATSSAGFATFQWRPVSEVGNSGFTATETPQPGFINDPSQTACSFRTPDSPDAPLALTSVSDGSFSTVIEPESIVTCRIVNLAEPAPAITLEKYTDGQDADLPTGPSIPRGDQVLWTYIVTNSGNTRLDSILVTDVLELPAQFAGQVQSKLVCPSTSLQQGASMRCSALGIAGITPEGDSFTGQYANFATVTATDSTGLSVSASDRSHYLEVEPGIQVEKSTNGEDADQLPGPALAVGAAVNWRYEVTNTGTEPLANIQVTDDDPAVTPVFQSGDSNNNALLDAGEVWLFTANGNAQAGQYTNRAIATGDGQIEAVRDEDPSHYFGSAPAVSLEKTTNGIDADSAPGPLIAANTTVTWRYTVTNTGNTDLASWSISDDQLGGITCPAGLLRVGQSASCSAQGLAVTGQYSNLGTVQAQSVFGGPGVSASDPSNYFGSVPSLTLEKTTNGADADAPTGPFIAVGDPVNWDFTVTNTGNVGLDILLLLDSELQPGAISCPPGSTALVPGSSATCTATGTATAGQYSNLGVVLARATSTIENDPNDGLTAAIDPSHYFGAAPGIDLEKFTNGIDADTPDEAVILNPGSAVSWGYLVGNTGNEPLNNVLVTDDQGLLPVLVSGDSNGNGQLDVGEYWLFEARGIAGTGLYTNLGSVSALDTLNQTISDTDPSHYLGVIDDITLEKTTNGVDADLAPGPALAIGDAVNWSYIVSNNGNVPLEGLTVDDDQGVIPTFVGGDLNNDGLLDPGESWQFVATGTAQAGQYRNLATARAISTDANGLTEEVEAQDPSHYFGGTSAPAIGIEKLTNGVDADLAPGPLLPTASTATFTYIVSNLGNVALSDILVTDDQGLTVSCAGGNPIAQLPVGGSANCLASSAVSAGPYVNIGRAEGRGIFGTVVAATDPSHHYGYDSSAANAALTLEKATNGQDADLPPGPALQPGDTVAFTYLVTNTGGQPISALRVSDDQGVQVSCPSGNPIPLLLAGASETCTGSATVAIGPYANLGTVIGQDPNGVDIEASDPSHHLGASPGIRMEKATNGIDADTPAAGPQLLIGTPVIWTYEISNIGNEPLQNVQVIDDQGVNPVLVAGDSNGNSILDLNETWRFEAQGTAQAGTYANLGSVAATDSLSVLVEDSDPSHYFGVQNQLQLEKSTNGVDADQAPGPQINSGANVTWEYVVRNLGNAPLSAVAVTDDQGLQPLFVGGDSNSDGLLDPSESWRFRASGPAVAGQYRNLGTATARFIADDGSTEDLIAQDPSHYFGGSSAPALTMEKSTNGEDADQPPGPLLGVGDGVVFLYLITNSGNVTLNDVEVTDDQGLTPLCVNGNPIVSLAPGEQAVCVALTQVSLGQYVNIGTATGMDPFGTVVNASDPSHHFGFERVGPQPSPDQLKLEKTTNGQDADQPPGPTLPTGSMAQFTYIASNTSAQPLRNVRLEDDQGVSIDCPSGNPIPLLLPGTSETCSGQTRVTDGQYRNVGTATAETPDGNEISAQDPSHHRGGMTAVPGILGLGSGLLALLVGLLGLRAARRRQVAV